MQVPFHMMFPMSMKAASPRTCGCNQCCLPWQGGIELRVSDEEDLGLWEDDGLFFLCSWVTPLIIPLPRIYTSLLLIWLPSIFKELSHQLTF